MSYFLSSVSFWSLILSPIDFKLEGRLFNNYLLNVVLYSIYRNLKTLVLE